MSPRRRRFLELAGGIGVGSLVGCTASDDGDESTPSSTPTPTPEPIEGNVAGTFAPEESGSGDAFGGAVALTADGSPAIVGADTSDDTNGFKAGSAYAFDGSGGTWSQQAKFGAEDGDPGDNFGAAVALGARGELALVSARWDEDPNGESAGSAYLFERSGGDWEQRTKLAASDGNGGAVFGWSVGPSTGGGTGLVGAPGDDENGRQAGLTYVLD